MISRRARRLLILAAVSAALLAFSVDAAFRWRWKPETIGPDEVGVRHSHLGSEPTAGSDGPVARAEVLGTGRHFINPLNETLERFPVVHIRAGTDSRLHEDGVTTIPGTPPEVGIVTSLVGDPLPAGEFLAQPGQRGVLKRVLTPGKYALNPHAHRVEVVPALVIHPGDVGVVTHLAGEPATTELVKSHQRGVLEDVLPPGLYYLNPREHEVTTVRIGYRELGFEDASSISFPASDGNTIKIDATVVWGIYPKDAPHVVKQFGADEKLVIDRVIRPEAESIMRTAGSDFSSREFVEGDSRERFQQDVTAKLKGALEKKGIRVLLALIRNIEVPQSVRKPIQEAKVAEEENLTIRVATETAKVQTELNAISGAVALEATKVRTETDKLVNSELSRGAAEVSRIDAETALRVAETLAEAARIQGEARRLLGEAEAEVIALAGAAEAEGARRRVSSFGAPDAYALWRFAEGLPPDLRIELRYAGAGTLWSDGEAPKVAPSMKVAK